MQTLTAAFLPRKWLVAPFAAFLFTDAVLNLREGFPIFTPLTAVLLLAFAIAAAIGLTLRHHQLARPLPVLGAAVLGSVLFYLR